MGVAWRSSLGHGGMVEKNCAPRKRLRTPPPPPSGGCLRKKSCRAIIVAFGKKFYLVTILCIEMEFFVPNFPLHMACTELFEPIDHFKLVLHDVGNSRGDL